jgi:hypothetical protein
MKKFSLLLAGLLAASSHATSYFSNSISYTTGNLGSVGSSEPASLSPPTVSTVRASVCRFRLETKSH